MNKDKKAVIGGMVGLSAIYGVGCDLRVLLQEFPGDATVRITAPFLEIVSDDECLTVIGARGDAR